MGIYLFFLFFSLSLKATKKKKDKKPTIPLYFLNLLSSLVASSYSHLVRFLLILLCVQPGSIPKSFSQTHSCLLPLRNNIP